MTSRSRSIFLAVCAALHADDRMWADAPSRYPIEPLVFRHATQIAAPSIVKIIADSTRLPSAALEDRPSDSPQQEAFDVGPAIGYAVAEGPSTGVIYSSDGLIVTSSFHFVRIPSQITVLLHDGRSFSATLLGRDQVRKLAFLRIPVTNLPTPAWVPPDRVRVGSRAIALGWGFGGQHPAPSVGIISAVDRMGGHALQTDANLSPANYGGPLIDVEGRVFGICVPMGTLPGETAGAELYDSGIGFAVGGWTLAGLAPILSAGKNVYRGFIGVRINDTEKAGAHILGVADPSPARDVGLHAGDRIVQIDSYPVRQVHTLLRHMNYRSAGETVQFVVQRGQKNLRVDVVLTARKELGDWMEEAPAETRPSKIAPTPDGRAPSRP